jgi:hypothetical protein
MTKHPVTPPPELLDKWDNLPLSTQEIFLIVAQWGADQELEACIANIHTMCGKDRADWLRLMRRPKPPSLKEQALELVDRIEKAESIWAMSELETIRRALEALPE